MQLADGTYLSFRYNDEGVRTRKTVNGVETYFYLDGTNILAQKTGNDILWFNYDANGTRISITMPNGAVYYYAYNAQGDVIGLYSVNQYGYFVPQVYYTYDAWGKVLSITGNMADTLGKQNPFRYRGYYYDSETQFYYLNSRYYDPEVGRFINADGYVSTGQNILGSNMFTYCGNNPVNRADAGGEFFFAALSLGTMLKLAGALLFTFAATAILTTPAVQQGISDAAVSIGTSISSVFSKSKSDEKENEKDITKSLPSSTVIYRYGGTNPGNLTPKTKDLKDGRGLSFSTVPAPGCSMTTIEALNATGIVYAVKDGATHVSVYPVGGTMSDWVSAGSSSIWTQAVKSVTIKWDGVS